MIGNAAAQSIISSNQEHVAAPLPIIPKDFPSPIGLRYAVRGW
jgi:hypothetical protein